MFAEQEMHAGEIMTIQQFFQQHLLVGHIGGEMRFVEAISAMLSQLLQLVVANLQMTNDITHQL